MRVIFPSSCRYLLPNTPGGALQQIWPNQFWLRRFSWFSGFPPLFWHRLPCFREGDACVGRQPPDTGGNFPRLGKNAAFNVGFAQFELESFFSPPIWSEYDSMLSVERCEVVGWVYWFLTECGFFLFAFFRRWFFSPLWFLSAWRSDENSRHTSSAPSTSPLYFTTVKPT